MCVYHILPVDIFFGVIFVLYVIIISVFLEEEEKEEEEEEEEEQEINYFITDYFSCFNSSGQVCCQDNLITNCIQNIVKQKPNKKITDMH